jgi:hypothetical protein
VHEASGIPGAVAVLARVNEVENVPRICLHILRLLRQRIRLKWTLSDPDHPLSTTVHSGTAVAVETLEYSL